MITTRATAPPTALPIIAKDFPVDGASEVVARWAETVVLTSASLAANVGFLAPNEDGVGMVLYRDLHRENHKKPVLAVPGRFTLRIRVFTGYVRFSAGGVVGSGNGKLDSPLGDCETGFSSRLPDELGKRIVDVAGGKPKVAVTSGGIE
ncbi:hypothetical protein PM082_021611 [Marasmius tenuissimus]|nr:hypothetical protein PM082_021611 [Marasmius tenuissimus]